MDSSTLLCVAGGAVLGGACVYLATSSPKQPAIAPTSPSECVTGKGRGEVDAFPNIVFIDWSENLLDGNWRNPCLIYDPAAFKAICATGKLGCFAGIRQIEAPRATIANWDKLAAEIGSDCSAIICIGGGTCIDSGKWVAATLGIKLICLPSAISVDAFFTGWSGYREDGCVSYKRTKAP